MDQNHILTGGRVRHAVAYTVGAACGFGLVKLYDKWRLSKTVYIPPEEPKEQQLSFDDVIGTIETVEQTEEGIVVIATVEPEVAEVIQAAAAPKQTIFVTVGEADAPVIRNVFARPDGTWDYEAEIQNRNAREPYVIHADEFIANEMDLRQTTVTYYEGDDQMADERDVPIYNHAGIMGELKWGHGSGDPNVVYIRNEAMMCEWEVLRHTGSFETEVAGLQAERELDNELRHSAVPRFRRE